MSSRPGPARPASRLALWLALGLVLAGMANRIVWMQNTGLWCDEAESAINGLTIVQTGFPGWKYLGLPVYENTLTEEWPDSEEYEFRDSTYSLRQGLVVYHGWLPLYAIAASEALFGMRADQPPAPGEAPRVLHGPETVDFRTTVPRLPSLLFSLCCLVLTFALGRALGGDGCGLAALTLMALNARTVDFGFQARYYALTLLMNVVVAWFLMRTARQGRWRDFLGLGVASAGLFHTHLFSAMAFSAAALACSPAILSHPGALIKSLCGGLLAAGLVLPWMVFSGFLETASAVPKVFHVFDSPWDLVAYAVDRPLPLALVAGLATLLLLARFRPPWLPEKFSASIRGHSPVYGVLLVWMATAYCAFHLIIPAASFFYERLSLVLWTPFVLVIGLLVADAACLMRPARAAIFAVLVPLAFLALRQRLGPLENTSLSTTRLEIQSLLNALSARAFAPGTRFYATPNEHLTVSYYSGIPVQSVAPVHREFLATYPKPVVYIEFQFDALFPSRDEALGALREAGWPLSDNLAWYAQSMSWNEMARLDLERRGIKPPPRDSLHPAIERLVAETAAKYPKYLADYQRGVRASPVLRGIPASDIKDIWMGFFYRFVEPGQRIGPNLNILPRLRNAQVELLPEATCVLYISNSPVKAVQTIEH